MFWKKKPWVFPDSKDTASITTRRVLEGLPVLRVTHDADDGMWQFLCGTTTDESDARVVGLGVVVGLDGSLAELADLPLGWRAWRAALGEDWVRERAN